VAQLVLDSVLGSNSSGVTTTDDDNLALGRGLDSSIEGSLGAAGKVLKLENTGGAVPENRLGLVNGLLVQLDGLLAAVETHPPVGDTLRVGGLAGRGVGGELVGGDVIDGEDELDVVVLGLLDQLLDELGAGLVEERIADGDVVERLLKGEGHTAADDEGVDLVEEVVDELDLVRDLGAAEDGEEGPLGGLEGLGEVVELLLHEVAGCLLGELNAYHGGVGAVGGAEGVVWLGRGC